VPASSFPEVLVACADVLLAPGGGVGWSPVSLTVGWLL